MQENQKVFKKVLDNGFTVLVRPNKIVPKVASYLFYNVGSKDERSGQKGFAHLLEHMIFKGTKKLSESDINLITNKLSGYCNAFTSYDYTGYIFDFPSHHWKEALPIFADCMKNCTIKQDLLNSEMKAVIQELKMYKDDYTSSLVESMISAIFADHPYHNPIIGYKQDLWQIQRDALYDFYKKYYSPNNATLVIVGDVDPGEVFSLAESQFSAIPSDSNFKKDSYYATRDIVSKSVTLYRDVQSAECALAFTLPGAREKKDYVIEVLSWILGDGKASRLQKKLVDEMQLVTDIESFYYDLFDHSLFFIHFEPKKGGEVEKIKEIILNEIHLLSEGGFTQEELDRARKQTESDFLSKLESNQKQAEFIGRNYLAHGDEQYLFNYFSLSDEIVTNEVKKLLSEYVKPSLAHFGMVKQLHESDKELWQKVQDLSDQEDAKILAQAQRDSSIEPGVKVHSIVKREPKEFKFPKPEKFELENGLKVSYYDNKAVGKIHLTLSLKAASYYDPQEFEGLYNFMSHMLLEGTKSYSQEKLMQSLENRGMNIRINPGFLSMSCLSQDLPKALEILNELVAYATFDEKAIEKVRYKLLVALENFWDEPAAFIGHLARRQIYKDHPYSKLIIGNPDSINRITKESLLQGYQEWLVPYGAHLSISGDLQSYDIKKLIHEIMGQWHGRELCPLNFPELQNLSVQNLHHQINRDQTVLAFAGKSIKRSDSRFDSLLLFDQIFTGGVLGSMSSRLFALREQSGLFYTIGGSLLYNTDEQPGMIYIRTVVSNDRLQEAEKAISETIDSAAHRISDHEFEQAQDALTNSLVDHFGSNKRIARSFLFLDRFGLPDDYFDKRSATLRGLDKEAVSSAVASLLSSDRLLKIRAGRR